MNLSELESQVDFLVTDNPNHLNKAAILQHVQYYADFQAEMDKTSFSLQTGLTNAR